jgi:MoxR-like ATPase
MPDKTENNTGESFKYTMYNRTKAILAELNKDIFEKEECIALTFLSAIASESIFLLGAPGVAKSLIGRRLRFAFANGKSFEYLMNRFSTPDEIFGPISISKLKNEDKYVRLTERYLPDSNVIFLDEIWKAGPSIQNALLTILNEKVYRNGDQEAKVDIRAIISASNELPEQGQGLEALWDRFLIRYLVDNIHDINNFNAMITNSLDCYEDSISPELKITDEEYSSWSSKIDEIKIPNEALNIIHIVRSYLNELKRTDIYVSDRRWRKIIKILRTSAFLNSRTSVDLMDCFLIVHCIWDKPDQIEIVKEIVAKAIKQHGYSLSLNINTVRNEILDFKNEIENDTIESKIEVPRTELLIINKDYYEIQNYSSEFRFIKKDDFERLSTTNLKCNLYNHNANDFTTNLLRKENQNTVGIHNQGLFQLKTQIIKEIKHNYRKPNFRLLKEWDGIVDSIKASIESEIKKAENYERNNLINLQNNLFVDKQLSVNVKGNIIKAITELKQLKVELEKIKYFYDTIEY